MAEQVKIQKTIYSLFDFNNVVDTEFTQLVKLTEDIPTQPDTTVPEFFTEYDTLFFEIPLSGSDESHLALATRSLDYLGLSLEDLQTEIDNLREENINLKNQLLIASEIEAGLQI